MAVYIPWAQNEEPRLAMRYATLFVRGNPASARLSAGMVEEFNRLAPEVATPDVTTLGERLDEMLLPQRMALSFFAWFGAVGVLLSCIGIYGLISYVIAQRRGEIALRLALGAGRAGTFYRALQWGVVPAGLGVSIGFVGAVVMGQFVRPLLYSVDVKDSLSFVSAGLLFMAAAGLASALAALRLNQIEVACLLRRE